jgi:hypothetical protein
MIHLMQILDSAMGRPSPKTKKAIVTGFRPVSTFQAPRRNLHQWQEYCGVRIAHHFAKPSPLVPKLHLGTLTGAKLS